MRRLKALLAAVAVSVVIAPAGALEVGQGVGTSTIDFKDQTPGDIAMSEQPESDEHGRWFMYQVVLWSPDTGFCIERRWTRDEAYANRQNAIGFAIRFDRATGAPRMNCPRNAVPVPTSLQQIAEATWKDVKNLPVPAPTIEPDHAVTGKRVYLRIAGQRTWTETVDNPIGDDITITATSDYVVDWGDAHPPTVTTSDGGAWPTGDLTHTYTDAAPARTITVTQRWTATWRAGQAAGTLTGLRTQGQPLTFEVRQLQAVRDR
jgi:hypothetical protein